MYTCLMHIRSSVARGTPIVDDSTQEMMGVLELPLIDPDTGKILGFFVTSSRMFQKTLFLAAADIIGWGTRVHVRSSDHVSPPEDLIRLQSAFSDQRPFLGQKIRTRRGRRSLGRCFDVQFNTRHFVLEWLFPKKFFILRSPIPASDILEVTTDAIWVRDPLYPASSRTSEMPEIDVSGVAATQPAA